MTPLDLVVFDVAGTTVRHDGQVPGAFEAALRSHGIEATAEQAEASADHRSERRWNIGALSGAHDRDAPGSAPHTHPISSVAALQSVWA